MNSEEQNTYNELYRVYYAYVFAAQMKMCGNRDQAEDLTQETFINILRYLPSFNPEKGNMKTWISVIARNIFNNHINKETRLYAGGDAEYDFSRVPDLGAIPEDEVGRELFLADVRKLLDALPEPERSIIIYKFFKNKTIKDTAIGLKISESTVCRRYVKGIELLQRQLNEKKITLD